jgi:hypothetical protein
MELLLDWRESRLFLNELGVKSFVFLPERCGCGATMIRIIKDILLEPLAIMHSMNNTMMTPIVVQIKVSISVKYRY